MSAENKSFTTVVKKRANLITQLLTPVRKHRMDSFWSSVSRSFGTSQSFFEISMAELLLMGKTLFMLTTSLATYFALMVALLISTIVTPFLTLFGFTNKAVESCYLEAEELIRRVTEEFEKELAELESRESEQVEKETIERQV